jgi:hypothetical protein
VISVAKKGLPHPDSHSLSFRKYPESLKTVLYSRCSIRGEAEGEQMLLGNCFDRSE